MNVKTSPSGAPPLARRAVSGLVRLLSNSCARVPAQLAGDSRNTVNTLPLHVPTQEKHRRAKDHNNQDDPDNAGHFCHPPNRYPRGKNIASPNPVSHINACSGSAVVSLPLRRSSISPLTTST